MKQFSAQQKAILGSRNIQALAKTKLSSASRRLSGTDGSRTTRRLGAHPSLGPSLPNSAFLTLVSSTLGPTPIGEILSQALPKHNTAMWLFLSALQIQLTVMSDSSPVSRTGWSWSLAATKATRSASHPILHRASWRSDAQRAHVNQLRRPRQPKHLPPRY